MRRNPVVPELAAQLSESEVRMLNALESAWRILSAASEGLHEKGAHNQADVLDEFAEPIAAVMEDIATEMLEEGTEREGGELEQSGIEIEYASLEEDFAMIYRDWLDYLEGRGMREFDGDLASVLRHAATYHPTMRQPLKEGITDDQLIDAAQDAYEDQNRRRR